MVTTNEKDDKTAPPKQAVPKKRIVVSTKKRRKVPSGVPKKAPSAQRKAAGGGLPSFRPRQTAATVAAKPSDPTDDGAIFGDDLDLEVPSDCLLAIQNLQTSSQGLHIPLTHAAAAAKMPSTDANATHGHALNTIQVVLESQIFQKFDENHASTIYQELVELKQKNVIRLLHCPNSTSNVWILTKHYIAGVWDSLAHHAQNENQQHQEILGWFVHHLQFWADSKLISEQAMKEFWNHKHIGFDTAIQQLLKLQVLLRDGNTSSNNHAAARYHLWLPKWGLVLKAWNEARQQLMTYVTMKKGISERNILNKNRHAAVSTKFLLDELIHQGKLKIVERPFGRFVQKVNS